MQSRTHWSHRSHARLEARIYARRRDEARISTRALDDADALEIRLDVTGPLVSMPRPRAEPELATNPLKEVPGFTGADLRALGYCVASASCLSVLWVAAGLVTRQFEPRGLVRRGSAPRFGDVGVDGYRCAPRRERAARARPRIYTSLAHYSSSLFGLAATMALVRTVR